MKKRILFTLLLSLILTGSVAAQLPLADSLYARRHTGYDSTLISTNPSIIDSAIDLYESAAQDTSSAQREEAMWKWLRAMYYKGAYTGLHKDGRKAIYEYARKQGEEWLETYPDSAPIHFWVSIHWGVWGRLHGVVTAARKGISGKMRKHAERVVDLDSLYEGGGGFRLLGRLHFKAPKILIIHNWPSKKKALAYLERAYAIDSTNLFTRQFLAESLYERGSRDRAVTMMQALLDDDTRVTGVLEDLRVRRDAEAKLEQWTGDD